MIKSLLKKEVNQKYIAMLITAIYFLLHLYVLTKHEPWRDEAQAWVISKNLNLFQLFKLLRTEGHPFLWFVFIMPFAKLGLSFYYVNYISLIVMCICVYIFIKHSPFNVFINIITLFSTAFFYFNPILFRLYCLPVLIILLICINYKNRHDKPLVYMFLIALLFQTHIKYSGFVFGLCFEYIYSLIEKKKLKEYGKFLLIPLFSLLFLIIELIPFGSYVPYSSFDANKVFNNFAGLLLSGIEKIGVSSFGVDNKIISYIIFIVFASLFLSQVIIMIKENEYENYLGILLAQLCGFGGYYIITAFVHGSHHQMSSILCMIMICVGWLAQDKKEKTIRTLILITTVLYCVLTIPININCYCEDINRVYSTGRETAEYIIDNLESDSIILLPYSDRNPLVYAFVTSKRNDIYFYDMNNEIEFTYHKWRQPYYEHVGSEIVQIAHQYFSGKNVYYLSSKELSGEDMKLVYKDDEISAIENENYWIYKIIN